MTSDISLKIPTKNDLDFIRWLWADPQTMEPVGGPIELTAEEALNWYAEKILPGSRSDDYRIILYEAKVPVGEVSFHRLDLNTMSAEFNIKIAAIYRGRGYAKQAMSQFIDYFFNRVGGQLLIDRVAKNNVVGKKALLAFGFREKPTLQEFHLLTLSKEQYAKLYAEQSGATG